MGTNPVFTLAPALPSPISTTPCGSTSNANVPHPLSSFIFGTLPPLNLPSGSQLITLPLPFGNFDHSQGEIVIQVTVNVSNFADPGVALNISARGGFEFGADQYNNPTPPPTLPDCPILSDQTAQCTQATNNTLWSAQAVTPRVMLLKKQCLDMNNHPVHEDETATGPNFPLKYQITADVANNQTINNLTVQDILPNNVQYIAGSLGVTVQGNTATLVPVCPGAPLPPTYTATTPTTPGGTLKVTLCQPVLGNVTTNEVVITFNFYIPQNDFNGNSVLPANCGSVDSINQLNSNGDWTPQDPCDQTPTPPIHITTNIPSAHALHDKCIAVQKSVSLVNPGPGLHPIPGDILQYTISFEISDYKTFGNIDIVDCLADGQDLILPGGGTQQPTLTVSDRFGTINPVAFAPGSDLTSALDPTCQCGGVTGRTKITFHVSRK